MKDETQSAFQSPTQAIGHDLGQLGRDAHALLEATAEATGEKIQEARERLTAALEQAKKVGHSINEQAAAAAKTADEAIRKNPYQALAAGFGLGAIVGILLCRR